MTTLDGCAGPLQQTSTGKGRRSVVFALVCSTVALALVGVEQRSASATVASVKGSAFGYADQITLFGSPQPPDGPAPTVTLASDASNSPQTATAPSGLVQHGPAVFFSSGQLDVSTQGTTGLGGSVTSSTSIANINTSGVEVLTAAAMTSTCTASESGVSASTTVANGVLQIDSGDDQTGTAHDPVFVDIPTNPAPNTTYDGHIHVNGTQDSFRYVFNEQVVNVDGSITVYAAHQYLLGPTAIGDLFIGKSECGVTAETAPPTVNPFCNPAPISEPNEFTFVSGDSVPYPSPIAVAGLTGTITDVNVRLLGLTSRASVGGFYVEDMDVLVAAPNNANVILMADAGGDNSTSSGAVTAADLTMDDEAAQQLPADALLTTGTWRPVDDDDDAAGDIQPDAWGPPAPALMDTTLLSTFDGIDPNGVWNLFVTDDQVLSAHDFLGGWCVDITTAVNEAPVAGDDTYSTSEDTVLTVDAPGVLGNDTDADGDTLTAGSATTPANGAVAMNPDGGFTYTPAAGFNGSDSFTYTVSDGNGGTDSGSVAVAVTAVNDAPVAGDDTYSTSEDTALTVSAPGVLGNDTDADGDALTATKVDDPAHGTVTLNADGSFTYTPAADYNGADSFTYTAGDGIADSNVATVTLAVGAVADAPVAVDDAYSTAAATPLVVSAPGVLGNDTDADGDSLTAGSASDPAGGSVALNADGSFTYTPDSGFSGIDTFAYTVGDGLGGSDTATVSVTVAAPVGPVVAVGDVSVHEGDAGTRAAVFTVSLSEPSASTVTVNYATANGTAGSPGDYTAKSGAVSFAPGATSATVKVPVAGDTVDEANESFTVNLSAPTGATLGDATGTGTVVDDDPKAITGIRLAIGDVAVHEGDGGTRVAVFTVSLSKAATSTVSVNYATANGTAAKPGDYTAKTGTLSFAAGVTQMSVKVTINPDNATEGNEAFAVNLSGASGATITDASGMGTIIDDD